MGDPESRGAGNAYKSEGFARAVLLGTDPRLRRMRRSFRGMPSDPRCKLCYSPFGGAVGWVMRRIGRAPWPKNPNYCIACFKELSQHASGAEIDSSYLFADVRGSTTLAEGMRPTEMRALMRRFAEVSTHVLIEHDAIVDKFVGDEIIGIFVPALAGELHAARAIAAARALVSATARWIPVGAGVSSGVAFVGTVGEGDQTELTAIGDPMNVAARLASAAHAGEVLVTSAAMEAARMSEAGLEHRELALKGKSQTTSVVVLGPTH